ncbi:MAG: helix-turn-helix domain-containing protein [Archaeoglobaceae archaeon]
MEEQVLEVLKRSGKPMRPGDIAKEIGVDSKDVSKAIKVLREKGVVYSPKRCYYAVREQ